MNYLLLENLGLSMDLSIIMILMILMIIICLIISIITLSRYNSLNNKYKKFMGGNEAKALESYITELIDINKENSFKINENAAEIQNLYKREKRDFQKMGMVKYDAFQEMGGNLSFALAVLDEKNNGFLINSVHNIQSSYCYAKEIKNGKCTINLSDEETEALEKALTSSNS